MMLFSGSAEAKLQPNKTEPNVLVFSSKTQLETLVLWAVCPTKVMSEANG